MPITEGLLLKSLSSLQHRQLEILLSPLAAQVAQLVLLVERTQTQKRATNELRELFPNLTKHAGALVSAAERLAAEVNIVCEFHYTYSA